MIILSGARARVRLIEFFLRHRQRSFRSLRCARSFSRIILDRARVSLSQLADECIIGAMTDDGELRLRRVAQLASR